jgi:uncharacterized protein (DUF697 family)
MAEADEIEVGQTSPTSPTPPDPHLKAKAEAIIRNRVYASLGLGFVPIPLVDLAALTAVQVDMVYRLGKLYGAPFNQQWIRKAVAFILGSTAPVFFTPSLSGLLRYIPVVGHSLGAASGSLAFGTATYLVGWAFARRFAKGEAIGEKDFQSIGEEVKAGFEKGKNKVKSWVTPNIDVSDPQPEPAD